MGPLCAAMPVKEKGAPLRGFLAAQTRWQGDLAKKIWLKAARSRWQSYRAQLMHTCTMMHLLAVVRAQHRIEARSALESLCKEA